MIDGPNVPFFKFASFLAKTVVQKRRIETADTPVTQQNAVVH